MMFQSLAVFHCAGGGGGGGKEGKNIIMGARKKMVIVIIHKNQGGRSCAGARGAPAEKFGLRRKF